MNEIKLCGEMIIFEINKIFREIFELRWFNRFKYRECIPIVVPIFITFVWCSMIYMSFMHFISNINDNNIDRALPSVTPFLSFSSVTIIYWYLLRYRADFYSIFDYMQAIVDESA